MRNILIVDDSKLICDRLVSMLRGLPMLNVLEPAGSISAAKQALGATHADLVILDIQLPDGNGIDLISVAKTANPSAKVVMLTNHALAAYKKRSLDEGADYFFDKSTEFEKLVEILAS